MSYEDQLKTRQQMVALEKPNSPAPKIVRPTGLRCGWHIPYRTNLSADLLLGIPNRESAIRISSKLLKTKNRSKV